MDGLQSKQEQHIYNVVDNSSQYEVIRERQAGGDKDVPPAQEIGGHYSLDWTTGLDYWTDL